MGERLASSLLEVRLYPLLEIIGATGETLVRLSFRGQNIPSFRDHTTSFKGQIILLFEAILEDR